MASRFGSGTSPRPRHEWLGGTKDRGLLGLGFLPGLIGAEAEPTQAEKNKVATPIELTLVGSYAWSDNPTVSEEVDRLNHDHWAPSTPDFIGVATAGKQGTNDITELANVWSILRRIVEAKKPIRRLNIFTHGSVSTISFSGTISPNGFVTFDKDTDDKATHTKWTRPSGTDLLYPYALAWELANPDAEVEVDGTKFSLRDVWDKFTEDAQIWLYSCNGAADKKLMKRVANTFQATTKGFDGAVVYCVTEQTLKGKRNHALKVFNGDIKSIPKDQRCKDAVADFHDLATKFKGSLRSRKPKPPP